MQNWAVCIGLPCRPPRLLKFIAARNSEMRSRVNLSTGQCAMESSLGKLVSMKTEHRLATLQSCILCGEHGYRSRKHATTGEPLFSPPRSPTSAERLASGRCVHAPWCRSIHRGSFTCTGSCLERVPVDDCKLYIGQTSSVPEIVSKLCHPCRHSPRGVQICVLGRS